MSVTHASLFVTVLGIFCIMMVVLGAFAVGFILGRSSGKWLGQQPPKTDSLTGQPSSPDDDPNPYRATRL